MEIFRIHINITGSNKVISEDTTVQMLLFDGFCTGEFFNGTILNGGVDTQLISREGHITLSARYMLRGHDNRNRPCSLFIENNAEGEDDITYTKPKIYTDSEHLKWLEQEQLTGRLENKNGSLVSVIFL